MSPNLIDLHVGNRIRFRRKELQISQGELAETLGVTFQQIQKYERGRNRISASKLYEAAKVLGVRAEYFFEGLNASSTFSPPDQALNAFLLTEEGIEMARFFPRLNPARRKAIVGLVHALSRGRFRPTD